MNSNIFVDVNKLEDAIGKLKAIKKRLETVVESQSTCTDKLKDIWEGTTGEELNKRLKQHNSDYNSILDNLDKRITFIESVKNSYLTMDSNLNKKIDDNAQ